MTRHHFSLLLEFLRVASYNRLRRESNHSCRGSGLHWEPHESLGFRSFLPLSQHFPILDLTAACRELQVCAHWCSLSHPQASQNRERGHTCHIYSLARLYLYLLLPSITALSAVSLKSQQRYQSVVLSQPAEY